MSSELLILIGTLSASFLGFLATLAATWLTKRSEERKHMRELAMRAAIEDWKSQIELHKLRPGGLFYPLDVYLVRNLKLIEILFERGVQTSNLEDRLKEVKEVTDIANQHARKISGM